MYSIVNTGGSHVQHCAHYALIVTPHYRLIVHHLNIGNISLYCVIDNCMVVFTELHGCTETSTWLM